MQELENRAWGFVADKVYYLSQIYVEIGLIKLHNEVEEETCRRGGGIKVAIGVYLRFSFMDAGLPLAIPGEIFIAKSSIFTAIP